MDKHIQHLAKDGHKVTLVSKEEASKYSGMPLLIFECQNCGTRFEVIKFPIVTTYHIEGELLPCDGVTCSELTIKSIIE